MATFTPLTFNAIRKRFEAGETPRQLLSQLLQQARITQDQQQNPVWLHLLSEAEIEPYLAHLEQCSAADLPLYGIPFAIKDNIDLAGIPTTAACAEFSYTAKKSAFVVEQLIAAGAVPLGKTNLDQFATGLVGVRSPFGACKNALNPEYISGGSSSGSAVAVAAGLVAFSLGTDTAGSGRVPAALNGLVGLKPSRGVLSNRGLVPACKSLDCISIFATNLDDASDVFDIAAAFDQEDPYARVNPFANAKRYGVAPPAQWRLGVPQGSQLAFFGDEESERLFADAVDSAQASGAEVVEIDFAPFVNAARLLYQGPWVAERYIATEALIEQNPQALLPVTREIIAMGKAPSARDAFKAQYALQEFAQQAHAVLAAVDCVMTPTIGTTYTLDEVEAEPIQLNSNLGYYTNFMNLLDCAAIAIPTGFMRSGVGFGVTLFQRAFSDKQLLAWSNKLLLQTGSSAAGKGGGAAPSNTVDVVVCGAHLAGLPLNWQLQERGARLLQATQTAPCYRFYALAGGAVPRPALVRSDDGGQAVEVEVWRMPAAEFGSFVAEIPAPLGIGKVELADGSWCSGFICDHFGLSGAKDITALGSWRRYLSGEKS